MSERDFLKIAEEAARAAGEVLESWAKKFTVREKSRANLVTEADFEAQDTIYRLIHDRYPDHDFLGEEGLSKTQGLSAYRWVIDPLDGTSNYVHRFPYYAVSIGLEYEGELIVGVVYDPNRDEMFSAVKGEGATLNGSSIAPTSTVELERAMVVASLPVGVGRDDPAVHRLLKVMPYVQTVQRTGSAALNLCYVAAGRIDAFWSTSLKPWDMAAGVLIIREAGGRVSKIDGSPWEVEVPDLLSACTPEVQEQLGQLLQ